VTPAVGIEGGGAGAAIGTAIVSYMEPHTGAARDFNRWYERDHFPAAVLAGPGAFAGGRFVATAACKEVRLGGDLFGDLSRGSYLSIAWLLPAAQAAWDAWVPGQMQTLVSEGRMFSARDHLQTAVYEYLGEEHFGDASAAMALDRRYAGAIAIAIEGDTRHGPVCGALAGSELPVVVELRRQRLLLSTLGEPGPHTLVLAFVAGDPVDVFTRLVAPALAGRTDIGFASPFVATVPGTDTYADQL
jgi:hypothetical protein